MVRTMGGSEGEGRKPGRNVGVSEVRQRGGAGGAEGGGAGGGGAGAGGVGKKTKEEGD